MTEQAYEVSHRRRGITDQFSTVYVEVANEGETDIVTGIDVYRSFGKWGGRWLPDLFVLKPGEATRLIVQSSTKRAFAYTPARGIRGEIRVTRIQHVGNMDAGEIEQALREHGTVCAEREAEESGPAAQNSVHSDPGMTEEGFQRMVLGDKFYETGVDDD